MKFPCSYVQNGSYLRAKVKSFILEVTCEVSMQLCTKWVIPNLGV